MPSHLELSGAGGDFRLYGVGVSRDFGIPGHREPTEIRYRGPP